MLAMTWENENGNCSSKHKHNAKTIKMKVLWKMGYGVHVHHLCEDYSTGSPAAVYDIKKQQKSWSDSLLTVIQRNRCT